MSQNNVGIFASQISGHLWQPAGAYDALATVTVPSGGAASVTFAGIPTGYKHLQIRFSARNNYTGSGGGISTLSTFNGDTATNYDNHRLVGDGGGTATAGALTGTSINYLGYTSRNGDTNNFTASVVDILDYANTSKFKTLRTLSGSDYNGSGYVQLWSGLWRSTAAISSMTLYPDGAASWTQFSTFALYGVK
jgi:hypothetical protein